MARVEVCVRFVDVTAGKQKVTEVSMRRIQVTALAAAIAGGLAFATPASASVATATAPAGKALATEGAPLVEQVHYRWRRHHYYRPRVYFFVAPRHHYYYRPYRYYRW